MKTKTFNNFIGTVHEIEMSRVLGVPRNTLESKGIDLLDCKRGVEVKSCLVDPRSRDSRKRYEKWTLFDDELIWDKKYNVALYCALGSYQMDVPVSRIWTRDTGRLEKHVVQREFWIVPWDWTMKFPVKKGKCHDYRYLRRNPIASSGIDPMPEVKYTKLTSKGPLHFVNGVNMWHFPGVNV